MAIKGWPFLEMAIKDGNHWMAILLWYKLIKCRLRGLGAFPLNAPTFATYPLRVWSEESRAHTPRRFAGTDRSRRFAEPRSIKEGYSWVIMLLTRGRTTAAVVLEVPQVFRNV